MINILIGFGAETMHEGHRQRMFEHLRKDAADLQDHELLEILLFYAIPRVNTNPLAHTLIESFGSLKAVFNAPMDALREVDGIGEGSATYLYALSELLSRIGPEKEEVPKVFNVHTFAEFLGARFEGCKEEAVEVYCLDQSHRVRFTKRFTSFKPDKVTIPPDEVGRLIATQRPFSVVVAHNHPDAPSLPSEADDRFTAQLQLVCAMHGAKLDDHIIVGEDDPFSYFLSGRLETLKQLFKNDLDDGGGE